MFIKYFNFYLKNITAQEIIKNCENWPPLQTALEQYFVECSKIVDELKSEKEDLIHQVFDS